MTRSSIRQGARPIALLGLIVLVSRLPFVASGYGADPDAWRIANAARHLATFAEYRASRLPGYPIPEGIYALLWSWGGRAIAFNVLSVLASALCAVTFALYLRRLNCKDWFLGGLALAWTPVLYIHSTTSMDYVWSLTFVLLASYFAIASRPFASGIFLGLAIGCRLTAGAMLLPLILMLAAQSQLERRQLARLTLPALAVGGLAYIPPLSVYGLSAFRFVEGGYDLLRILYLASLGVWGVIGSLALGAVVSILLWRFRSGARVSPSAIPGPAAPALGSTGELQAGSGIAAMTRREPGLRINRMLIASWASAVLLFGIAFVRLPHEAGYLLPVVPFVILLLGVWTKPREFKAFCLSLALSPFLMGVDAKGIHLDGPILRDHAQREERMSVVEAVLRTTEEVKVPAVLSTGWYLPMIEAELGSDKSGPVQYVGLIAADDLQRYRDAGRLVYYLPQVREYNLRVHGFDLANTEARPWHESGPE